MSETQTQTLAAWLLERIAEDEAAARDAIDAQTNGRWSDEEGDPTGFGFTVALPLTFVEHIARHDPARVLAECEAKRALVEIHGTYHECSTGRLHGIGVESEVDDSDALCPTILILALPYADQPGFQEEWRP